MLIDRSKVFSDYGGAGGEHKHKYLVYAMFIAVIPQ